MNINTEAGKKIIEARNAKGLTQMQAAQLLAKAMGGTYSLRQYAKLEAGSFPKYKKNVIEKLDEILGTELTEHIYEQNVPREVAVKGEAGKEIGRIREDVILLKASVRILGMHLSELLAVKNKMSVTKASLELERTISQEVDRLWLELSKQ